MQALGGWAEVRDNASLNRRYLKVNDHQEVLLHSGVYCIRWPQPYSVSRLRDQWRRPQCKAPRDVFAGSEKTVRYCSLNLTS